MAIKKVSAQNIGATETLELPPLGKSDLLLTFTGSSVGNVTATVKVFGGDKFEAVTGGTISLATVKYILVQNCPAEAVYLTYDGVTALNVDAFVMN